MTELSTQLCACGCGQYTRIAPKTTRSAGHAKGEPYKYVCGHNRHANTRRWYRATNAHGNEHRRVVERALGHPLRSTAPVHHVNENKRDNSPGNLVACDSHAYHNTLHMRQRALDAYGDANARKCLICSQYDSISNMVERGAERHRVYHHQACEANRQREWKAKRRKSLPYLR